MIIIYDIIVFGKWLHLLLKSIIACVLIDNKEEVIQVLKAGYHVYKYLKKRIGIYKGFWVVYH